mmetsp:Transcript_11138/g.30774  ORF Transcript_11138/g.30774 Transcript_11138/m.30774 type:complete len:299 (+) Transcript_11138:238-1134(+)
MAISSQGVHQMVAPTKDRQKVSSLRVPSHEFTDGGAVDKFRLHTTIWALHSSTAEHRPQPSCSSRFIHQECAERSVGRHNVRLRFGQVADALRNSYIVGVVPCWCTARGTQTWHAPRGRKVRPSKLTMSEDSCSTLHQAVRCLQKLPNLVRREVPTSTHLDPNTCLQLEFCSLDSRVASSIMPDERPFNLRIGITCLREVTKQVQEKSEEFLLERIVTFAHLLVLPLSHSHNIGDSARTHICNNHGMTRHIFQMCPELLGQLQLTSLLQSLHQRVQSPRQLAVVQNRKAVNPVAQRPQ